MLTGSVLSNNFKLLATVAVWSSWTIGLLKENWLTATSCHIVLVKRLVSNELLQPATLTRMDNIYLEHVGPVIFRDRGKVAEFSELPT